MKRDFSLPIEKFLHNYKFVYSLLIFPPQMFFIIFKFTDCPPNCAVCPDVSTCAECVAGYGLDVVDGRCLRK